jgi:hypothetical protein
VTSGVVGLVYEYNITTSDQDGDSRVITAETTLTWLTLTDYGNGTALLTGTPIIAGDYDVKLRVSDGDAYSDQSFSIKVTEDLFMIFLPLFIK